MLKPRSIITTLILRVGTQFEFAAMVFESTGGVNKEGLAILRQLFRFAAKREGTQ